MKFTWHGNRHSTGLQGTSARAMFCWKIAEVTQNCHTRPSEPGWCPDPHVPAIHLTRQSPFYGPPRHIGSRDGIDLCPSSAATPSRHRFRAHPLARCFAGSSPNDIELPRKAVRARLVPRLSSSCNSSDTATAIPRGSRAHPLARWFAGRSQTCYGPATHGRQGPVSAQPSALLQFI